MHRQEIEWEGVDWIDFFNIGTSSGLLQTWR